MAETARDNLPEIGHIIVSALFDFEFAILAFSRLAGHHHRHHAHYLFTPGVGNIISLDSKFATVVIWLLPDQGHIADVIESKDLIANFGRPFKLARLGQAFHLLL